MTMDLRSRVLEGELMDAPDLDGASHRAALLGLRRVNFFSGTAAILSRAIVEHCRERGLGLQRPVRVLDLACGGGDVTLAVAKQLLAADLKVHVEGWDRSATAIAFAQSRLEQLNPKHSAAHSALGRSTLNATKAPAEHAHPDTAYLDAAGSVTAKSDAANSDAAGLDVCVAGGTGAPMISFHQRAMTDLNGDDLSRSGQKRAPAFDVVMCTLFLHHLSSEQASDCLKGMYAAACELVLVDDLRRTWLGYRLAQLGCQLLTRSPIVHIDGPLSVRAAFTEDEVKLLSQRAGLPEPVTSRHWPQRFLMKWKRHQ